MNRKVSLLLLTLIVGMCVAFVPGSAFAASHGTTPTLGTQITAHTFPPRTQGVQVATPRVSSIPLSQAVCSQLIAGLKTYAATSQGRQVLSFRYHLSTAAIVSLKSTSCVKWSRMSVGQTTTHTDGRALSYNYVTCVSKYYSDGISIGPFPIVVGHVNVGMCYNGWAAWPNWGPSCYVSTVPWMGYGVTWCGVWNSGNYQTQPGMDYNVYNYSTWWWKSCGWMRTNFWGNGSSSGTWTYTATKC